LEINLEAGDGGEQLQCWIYLEIDGEGGFAALARLSRVVVEQDAVGDRDERVTPLVLGLHF
jgi:hypothetical protein